MIWDSHPLHGRDHTFRDAEILNIGKLSFLVMRTIPGIGLGTGWELSWKNWKVSGSVEPTIERGFHTKAGAKARCEAIYRQLTKKQ